MSFLDKSEVTQVALNLITRTISIACSMIERDTEGVYVYINPLDDLLKPAARGAKHNQSYEQKKLSVRTEVQSDSDETIRSRTRPYSFAARDSMSTIESKRYSYFFNPPQQRTSLTPSVRASLEPDGFIENLKSPPKEQMWNYVMSDVSSDSKEYLEENTDITEQDIQDMQEIVYEWPTIADFTLDDTINTIQRFVSLWKVSVNTKFALLRDDATTKGCLGERYHVTVAFSKPTKRCPNPLAVAYVNFEINYSYIMPQDFPIIVTYRFETYKQSYHVLGKKNMRSISFQNFYIENILNAKLSFYAQVYETTYGPLNQKLREYSVDEEYEIFKSQAEFDISVSAPYMQPNQSTSAFSGEQVFRRRKGSQTLLNITRMSAYKHLIDKIEPWKLQKYDPAAVHKAHKEMKQDEHSVELDSVQNASLRLKQNLSVFGLNEPEVE